MTEIQGPFFAMILFILLTIIIVVLLVQVFSSYRARMSITREEAYRKLAEQATTAEQKVAEQQQKTAEALEAMRTHLASIEKLLRDVE